MNSLDVPLVGVAGPTSLRAHLRQAGVIVYFVRDFGCHSCANHALSLAESFVHLQAEGYGVVVVGSGSAAQADKVKARLKLPFDVLADPTHEAFDAFGLGKVLGYWQKSGCFVVDLAGKTTYGKPSNSPKEGLDVHELLSAVRQGPVPTGDKPCA